MNNQICEFIKELRDISGNHHSFVYQEQCWGFSNCAAMVKSYVIFSPMSGFNNIEKNTEEELIASFDLIRNLVKQLCGAEETTKQINMKLICNGE